MTQYTDNYKLELYEGTDKADLTDQYNASMRIMDGALSETQTNVDQKFKEFTDTVNTSVEGIRSDLATTNSNVNATNINLQKLTENVVNIETKVDNDSTVIGQHTAQFTALGVTDDQSATDLHTQIDNTYQAAMSNTANLGSLQNDVNDLFGEVAGNTADIAELKNVVSPFVHLAISGFLTTSSTSQTIDIPAENQVPVDTFKTMVGINVGGLIMQFDGDAMEKGIALVNNPLPKSGTAIQSQPYITYKANVTSGFLSSFTVELVNGANLGGDGYVTFDGVFLTHIKRGSVSPTPDPGTWEQKQGTPGSIHVNGGAVDDGVAELDAVSFYQNTTQKKFRSLLTNTTVFSSNLAETIEGELIGGINAVLTYQVAGLNKPAIVGTGIDIEGITTTKKLDGLGIVTIQGSGDTTATTIDCDIWMVNGVIYLVPQEPPTSGEYATKTTRSGSTQISWKIEGDISYA